MSANTIAIVVLVAAAGLSLVLLAANAASKRRPGSDIPPGMRPAYSDEQLEGPVLERYLSWGLLLTLFFAIFLPAYWWREPERIGNRQEEFFTREYAAGEQLYSDNCSTCHGADGSGGSAPSPYGGDPWPAPNLRTVAQRYADSQTVADVREHVRTTIDRGRPGTPMAAWGAAFGGPMTDYQVNAIVDWILANQDDEVAEASAAADLSGEQLYQQNCARCHGANLGGIVGPSLIGVFERHSEETVLGIIANGINGLGNAGFMPPWQNGYMYEDTRYDDDALQRIVDYLAERQPAHIPDDATGYQTPGRVQDEASTGDGDGDAGGTEEPSEEPEPTDEGTEV